MKETIYEKVDFDILDKTTPENSEIFINTHFTWVKFILKYIFLGKDQTIVENLVSEMHEKGKSFYEDEIMKIEIYASNYLKEEGEKEE